MKKIFTIFISAILLTGCSAKTDYEQFKSDVKPLQNAKAINITVNSTIEGSSSELDGTDYVIEYTFNKDNKLIKMVIDTVDVYLTPDTMYMEIMDIWFKKAFVISEYSELNQMLTFKESLIDLPKGDTTFGKNTTGIEEIDSLLAGQSLNQLLVKTGENTYTFTGLENNVALDTTDGLKLTFTYNDETVLTLQFSETDKISLPEAASTSIETDNLGI